MSAAILEGPDFLAFIVEDVEETAKFWTDVVGLKPAPHSPPGAKVFETRSIPFAIRAPYSGETCGNDNSVSVWFSLAGDVDDYRDSLLQRGADVGEVKDGPFGRMFALHAPGGFSVTVHAARP